MLVFLAAFLVGCGKVTNFGGKPTRPPERVVSLSPSTTEIISFDGLNGQLVGRTTSCNYPLYIDKLVPVYGSVKPDYEKLATVKGLSLVVYERALYSDADIAKLKEIGIPLFEFHAKDLEDFRESLKDLGQTLGAPLTTSQYLDKIQNSIEKAKASPPAKPAKVAVMTGNMIVGKNSFLADVIKTCGGTPAGPDADKFVPANPEQLIADNPDAVILAADISKYVADKRKQQEIAQQVHDAFAKDPRYKSLNAVKNDKIFPMDADVLLRQGVRVDKLIEAIATVVQAGGKE